MMHRLAKLVLVLGLFFVALGCASAAVNEPEPEPAATDETTTVAPESCDASEDWVTNPENAPAEVPMGENAQICQFHQFSWQWFINLLNETGSGVRQYEDQEIYPLLLVNDDSCTATGVDRQLFVRVEKDDDGQEDDFILPERIDQADGSIIYDQKGNIIYYEVRFSREFCSLEPSVQMFPPDVTELKVSWRVITEAEKSSYVWINADIDNNGTIEPAEILGMVGFHLVKSTPLHPEFIWATFEHKQNAPECQTAPSTTEGWSFTSAACTAQLPASVNPTPCPFNGPTNPPTPVPVTGGPKSEVCRVYHAGSKPGDNQYDTNVAAIDQLNAQLTGPNGFITALPASNPLAILQNYELVGALWENDVSQPSSDQANQRGSIQLANTTMETTTQQGFQVPYTGPTNSNATNCFGCHNYTPGSNAGISHIFKEIHGPSN